MKKVISIILTLSMTIGILAGCSSKKSIDVPTNKDSSQTSSGKSQPSTSGKSTNTDKPATPGTELSDFLGKYSDTKSKLWDQMSKELEKEENFAFAMGMAGLAFADLIVVEVLLFDTLTVNDGGTYKGKLMFSGIDAWKKVNGDIIEFGYDFTAPNQDNKYKQGDHAIAKGKLDKSKNSLVYEYYVERDGKITSKYIVEVTRNSDSSYSSQTYVLDLSEGSDTNKVTGYLTWFDEKNIISYLAEKDITGTELTYSSIFGKKNVKPDEMAQGMTITMKTSYMDGKSTFEDLSSK